MIGPAPDLGGNVTVMPLCVSCGGAASSTLPQAFENPWRPSPPIATPHPLCPPTSCPNPSAGGGSSVQERGIPSLPGGDGPMVMA